MPKRRLDTLLAERGLYESRSRAAAAVLAGDVRLGGQGRRASKRGQMVTDDVDVEVADSQVAVTPRGGERRARAMWGTTRSLIQGMVTGVSAGFSKSMEISGTGYRAAVQGKDLVLNLGFSHEVKYPIPEGIKITAERPTLIKVEGADKRQVGQVAAEIRRYRQPEPYKGKGVKFAGEFIFRKEGKKK